MMKRSNLVIWVMVAEVCVFGFQKAEALTTTFNDGVTHEIYHDMLGDLVVRNSFWDEPTTINLVPGGEIKGDLRAYDNSQVTISGGMIGTNLTTGGSLKIHSNADVVIDAINCQIAGRSVSGLVNNPKNIVNQGRLVGEFLDGSSLDVSIELEPDASFTVVPEPGSLLLLGLGGLVLRKRV